MAEFILSGFGDEIDSALDTQMEVMSKLGIAYIETRGIDGKNIADFTVQEARTHRARLTARGFGVSALGSPAGKMDIKDEFAPHLDNFRNLLDIACAMQTQYIRLFSFFLPDGEDAGIYRDAVMERLSLFVQAARGSGITLLHENEKFIYGDVTQRCMDILETFKGDIFATYDPSNFVQCGVDNKEAFEALLPYIRYMHIKDSIYSTNKKLLDKGFDTVSDAHRPAGYGDGQLPYIIGRLRQEGYQGFLSIEPHLSNNDAIPGGGKEKFIVATDALKKLL